MSKKLTPEQKRHGTAIDKMMEIAVKASKGEAMAAIIMFASCIAAVFSQLEQAGIKCDQDKIIDEMSKELKTAANLNRQAKKYGGLH